MRLFDMVVTQSALWCCESWLLTQEEKRYVQSTQNQMLRRFAGGGRRPDEDYVQWIVRATRLARERASAQGVRFWVETHLRYKWQWAGHIMRQEACRLTHKNTRWRDSIWWAEEMEMPRRIRITRPHRDHWFRWEDELKNFCKNRGAIAWQNAAACRQAWHDAADAYVHFCIN